MAKRRTTNAKTAKAPQAPEAAETVQKPAGVAPDAAAGDASGGPETLANRADAALPAADDHRSVNEMDNAPDPGGVPGSAAPLEAELQTTGEPGEGADAAAGLQHATDVVLAADLESRPHPFERLGPADLNLIGAYMAANAAHAFHTNEPGSKASTAWCPSMGFQVFTVSKALETAGAFVRANRDARPQTLALHLRMKGHADTPDPADNEAHAAAWTIFAATLNALDAASQAAAERAAADDAAAAAATGPRGAPAHHLAENPMKRHPLTQQGRMVARGRT